MTATPGSAEEVRSLFDEHDYLADVGTSTALFLALELGLPLLLEGEPGVGKTEAGKVLARALGVPWSGCSATRVSPRARRSTTGTTSGSSSRSGSPRRSTSG